MTKIDYISTYRKSMKTGHNPLVIFPNGDYAVIDDVRIVVPTRDGEKEIDSFKSISVLDDPDLISEDYTANELIELMRFVAKRYINVLREFQRVDENFSEKSEAKVDNIDDHLIKFVGNDDDMSDDEDEIIQVTAV